MNGSQAIGTIGALLTLVKQIRPLIEGVTNKELNENLLEFQQKLLDLQIALAQLNQTNMGLQAEVVELQQQLSVKETLTYDGHVYWSNKEGKKDGPFCPLCWDKEKQLVHLSKRYMDARPYGYCSLHKIDFDVLRGRFQPRINDWLGPDESE